jgi:hypothetical protein
MEPTSRRHQVSNASTNGLTIQEDSVVGGRREPVAKRDAPPVTRAEAGRSDTRGKPNGHEAEAGGNSAEEGGLPHDEVALLGDALRNA